MVKEGTVAVVGTTATTETAPAVRTVATAARPPKVFRKRAIIAAGEKTVTVAASAFKKSSAASFNKKEKYIWINDNAAAFAWREREIAPARAWKG